MAVRSDRFWQLAPINVVVQNGFNPNPGFLYPDVVWSQEIEVAFEFRRPSTFMGGRQSLVPVTQEEVLLYTCLS